LKEVAVQPFPLSIFALLRTAPSADERNIALLTEPADLLTGDCAAGTLPTDRAAFGSARRVWALPGPGASLRGLAAILQQEVLRKVAGWAAAPETELGSLGAALFRVGRRIDSGTGTPLSDDAAAARWLVGTTFPLPVWQPAGEKVQAGIGALREAMDAVGPLGVASIPEWVAAGRPARPLDQVDPFETRTAVTGAGHVRHAVAESVRLRGLAAAASSETSATALGATWGRNARWNPYAAVFPVLEFAARYRASPGLIRAFTTGFYGELTARETDLFASTSAGYALIRCLWRASEAGRTKAIADLLGTQQTNLALVDDYPPDTGRLEPPVRDGRTAPKLPVAASTSGAPNPLMGFGRVVPFVVGGYQGKFRGVRWAGTVPPSEVLAPANGAPLPTEFQVPPGGDAAQWAKILGAISTTEGNLDAVTSWDSATVSLGFQQWSMHVRDSGPALLARVKTLHPEVYDAVVRSAEFDAGQGATAEASAGVSIQDILTENNLWNLSPAGASHLNGPGYTARRVQAGFGWRLVGKTWVIGEPCDRLCARWAVAARFVPAIWQAQAETAYAGVVRLRAALLGGAAAQAYPAIWRGWPGTIKLGDVAGLPGITDPQTGTSRAPTVFELFLSEAAVASILDHSINLPGHVAAAIGRALRHAAAARVRDNGSAVLDSEFLLRLLIAHQGARQLTPGGTPVDVARERVPRLILLYDAEKGMSTTRPFRWPSP
jgi:hypothetical protein